MKSITNYKLPVVNQTKLSVNLCQLLWAADGVSMATCLRPWSRPMGYLRHKMEY